MANQKFLEAVTARLEQAGVDEETISFAIGKIKQSFKNGVAVGAKQGREKEE